MHPCRASAGQSSTVRFFTPWAIALLPFVSFLPAQGTPPAGATPPAATNPAASPAPAPAAQGPDKPATPPAATNETPKPQDAAPVAGSLGTVLVAKAKVRCWNTESSPCYEDVLAQGTVVGVGPSQGGFRRVILPLGPIGYVFQKFTTEAEGKVTTKGQVAFRYRPQTKEAPVSTLAPSTELQIVGEKKDEKTGDGWWIVRNPAAEAWVAEAEVQVFQEPPETMRLAQQEQQKLAQAQLDGWKKEQADKAERARLEKEHGMALATLAQAVAAEKQKPVDAQKLEVYGELEGKLEALGKVIAADSALQENVKALRKSIADRKFVLEATAIVKAEPVPAKDVPEVTPQPADALSRFSTIGWLRWEKGLVGPGRYVVEKGGQRLFLVQCTNGRYDLSMFVDKEVGLVGPSRRPAQDSLRLLDIEKIEIVGLAQQ